MKNVEGHPKRRTGEQQGADEQGAAPPPSEGAPGASSAPVPGPARSVTIVDVARHAGVSKTTASDALSGAGRVSARTRARIEEVAARLGYHPNTAARHLRNSRVGAVGLYLPRQVMGTGFYMEFAFGVAERARAAGLDLTLLGPDSSGIKAPRLRVDGLIILDPILDDPVVADLLGGGVPVVTVGYHRGSGPAPRGVLSADHVETTNLLLEHLGSRGSTMPGLIMPDGDFLTDWSLTLQETYERWCSAHGVEPATRGVAVDASPETLDAVVRDLMASRPDLDALVCAPDGSALRALGTLRSLGRRVGEELLLASCVASQSLEMCDPPITAVDLRPRAYGASAAELLAEILAADAADDEPITRVHPAELRIHASTGSEPAGPARP
ncbi:LacI family DNA-binding transcriptional regulator [Microbispora sp. NEAU-D428]|uniref:LacI family DNA-binding transcriptional regulator n=1 Tax=Microbispora sitophila TaxID=2771537 RepID=UPI001868F764|nr:LacI family DNA-binding transcriptional regulator [Microbispora sitophila]MBE3010320.1 LacI family DNA-binding transcriptional regulator [Microbispora sitophila]